MNIRTRIDFTQILRVLVQGKVDFIVVGGVSAVLRGAPVATFDLDVVHSREPGNVERLKTALDAVEARYRSRPDTGPDSSHLATPGHQLLMTRFGPLDVLGQIGKGYGYRELLPHAPRMQVAEDIEVPVLSLEMLIRTKEETSGKKDRAVLPILRRTLDLKSNG